MAKSIFFDLFPVPKYLKHPAIGFDVSDGSVKFIELIDDVKGFRIGRYGRKEFNFKAEDDPGNTLLLIKTLQDIKNEYGIDRANISLPEEQAYFIRLRLPSMMKKDIRTSIELQLEEYIPYSPNEVVFDYEIIKEDASSGGSIDVSVSVLTQAVVNKYLNIFNSAGIMPMSFEVEAESTVRSLIPKNSDKTFMIVNVGKVNSVLSIVSGANVWFSYTMKSGGDFFTKMIARCLSLPEEEAEKLKMAKGLSRVPENQELLFCLAPAVSSLRDEIIKHHWYWNTHKIEGSKEIEKIMVCGSQSNINALTDYLSMSLGLEVVLGNPWVNLISFDKYIPEIGAKEATDFATAIGLAMKTLSGKSLNSENKK